MIFDKNQTEFPTEKHKDIWGRAMLYVPEEIALSDEIKASIGEDLFESCKQMRQFVFHALRYMYENAEIYGGKVNDYIHHNFEIIERSEIETNGNLVLNKLTLSKNVFSKLDGQLKSYADLFANTGIQINENDSSVKISNILYPKMFYAMKELINKKSKYGRSIVYFCDFRKLSDDIKLVGSKKIIKGNADGTINDRIDDSDVKKLVLDFFDFMQKNKMTLRSAGFGNAFKALYKGKCICYVRLKGGSDCEKYNWVITPYLDHIGEYEESIIEEGLQDFIWDNVFHCKRCFPEKYPEGRPCVPGRNITLLGKEIKEVCVGRWPIWFYDPNETEVNRIEWLLELEQQARNNK